MANIFCSVSNCHYWKGSNKCGANQIMVTADEMGAMKPDDIDASDHASITETPVGSCMETCCKTFVEKGSGMEKVDGTMKM